MTDCLKIEYLYLLNAVTLIIDFYVFHKLKQVTCIILFQERVSPHA